MTRYAIAVPPVEAVQFKATAPGAAPVFAGDAPWLSELLGSRHIARTTRPADSSTEVLVVQTRTGARHLRAEDWIVRDADGHLDVHSPTAFDALFTALPDDTETTDTTKTAKHAEEPRP